jgi:hypothetical protein
VTEWGPSGASKSEQRAAGTERPAQVLCARSRARTIDGRAETGKDGQAMTKSAISLDGLRFIRGLGMVLYCRATSKRCRAKNGPTQDRSAAVKDWSSCDQDYWTKPTKGGGPNGTGWDKGDVLFPGIVGGVIIVWVCLGEEDEASPRRFEEEQNGSRKPESLTRSRWKRPVTMAADAAAAAAAVAVVAVD